MENSLPETNTIEVATQTEKQPENQHLEAEHEAPFMDHCEHCCGHCHQASRSNALIVGLCVLVASLIVSASLFIIAYKVLGGKGPAVLGAQTTAGQAATSPDAGQPNSPQAPVNIPLAPNTPVLGNTSAGVTIVEYADYQCPFCEKFYTSIWPDLKTKYVDTGKAKFVYQDFPFLGADSGTAANAAQCAAEQNKFWEYHDYLFSHQGQENSGWAMADHLKQFAQLVGLNTAQFNQCVDSNKYSTQVQNELMQAKGYGVTGTPTIFINGTPIVGTQPVITFEQAIDKALQQ